MTANTFHMTFDCVMEIFSDSVATFNMTEFNSLERDVKTWLEFRIYCVKEEVDTRSF